MKSEKVWGAGDLEGHPHFEGLSPIGALSNSPTKQTKIPSTTGRRRRRVTIAKYTQRVFWNKVLLSLGKEFSNAYLKPKGMVREWHFSHSASSSPPISPEQGTGRDKIYP